MTDDELLARLADTPVEEWSLDELELLRARAAENHGDARRGQGGDARIGTLSRGAQRRHAHAV